MPDVELNWLLDDLAQRVTHIEQVLMLSRDGLAVGASSALGKEDAERLAAIAAGFQSLGRGAAEYLIADQVRQIIVEMSGKFLFITSAGQHGCLAVVTAAGADLGMVAYEMAMVAKRVSGFMPRPRRSLQPHVSGNL
jgi:predicted regulator of Ras-like GTPase activity (Roadblock/LC7/MglB family)